MEDKKEVETIRDKKEIDKIIKEKVKGKKLIFTDWHKIGLLKKGISKEKLNESGIILSEPKRTQNQEFFRIRTAKRENIKRFFEVILSEHPKKIIKFQKIIEKCQKK